jgi:hypothetical protein
MDKKVLGLSLLIVLLVLAAGIWLLQNGQPSKEEVITNPQITLISNESCSGCKMGLINSYWENNDLIVLGAFNMNCCPGKLMYDYELSGDNLEVILKDQGLCNCFGITKSTLRITGLPKKEYNITVDYRLYK